jgi:thiaminase
MNTNVIKTRASEVQKRLSQMSDKFPWEDKHAYTSWLAQSYEYVRFSTRILALTAGHFPLDKTTHATRFIQHAAEEKGHDRLLVNDAKALGFELSKIETLPEAEAFHKSLYFWIYQGRPSVILGWVLALEGFAVGSAAQIFERVQKVHGKKAASFIYVHSNEDQEHVEKAFEALEGFSESDLQDVLHGLELYSSLYENIYTAVEGKTTGALKKRAA